MGGLRIFGTKSRVVQEPKTMVQKAAKAFEKYHELRGRVLDRMENPRTIVGVFVHLMLANRLQRTKEETDVKKGLDEVEKMPERRKVRPAGITQDARGWYNECGRPRYPLH